MKKHITLLIIFIFGWASSQSGLTSSENYSYTKTCLTEDCSKRMENVTYYDGLARPKQIIDIKGTSSGKDMVQYIEYDPTGITNKSYLPVPQLGTQNGAFYTDPLSNASQVYGSEKIFGKTIMDIAPYNRVKQSIKPGTAWENKPVQYSYSVNTANEVLKFNTSTVWENNATKTKVTKSGYYPQQKLSKNSVTDEDGNTMVEYKNGSGQTLLVKKMIGASESVNTYYIYNEYNQLVFVLSPQASEMVKNLTDGTIVSQSTLDEICYQYRYDSKGRQVEKKLPGKGWEYFVYDQQDRLIMSKDTNLKNQQKWLFTKYDHLGRPVYTGITSDASSRNDVQVYVNGITTNPQNNEAKSDSGFSSSGTTVYYTNTAFPVSIEKVLSVNYYDQYPLGSPAVPSQILGQNVLSQDSQNADISTKTLATASYVKNIEDDNWTKNYIWYDTKGRVIGTYSINHLGGYTKTESLLDFAGVTQQSKVYHKRLSSDTEKVITQAFEYDSQNRLKKQWHQVNSQPQELLAENTYNDLGQLSNKKVGNSLQSIDYTYNILGAITKINDPANLNGKLFAYEIKYQNPVTAAAKYNGIITEVDWKTSTDNILRRYAYQYDELSRLKKGTYAEPNSSVPQNSFYNETLGYDINGNITSLQRNTKGISGTAELIDNLTYVYNGNRLNTVTDTSTNYKGYPDTSGNAIGYDDNGNMTMHPDKGILQIDYNFLDLPEYVKFNESIPSRGGAIYVNTKYTYRADGTKIRKEYNYKEASNPQLATTTTDYMDGFQYEATVNLASPIGTLPVLKFVPTAEGYYNFENNKYIYSYLDHLGNVRLSYMKNGSGAEIIEENNFYPFGMKHEGYNPTAGNPAYNYGYNGKELQKETGWSDYGARMYMSDIGRWGVVDPLAEQMRGYSPYNYANNNPVNFIDPDGRKAIFAPTQDSERSNPLLRGGFLWYYAHGGTGKLADVMAYLGQENATGGFFEDAFHKEFNSGGGGEETFGETQEYKDIMAYLAQPEYFQGIDFEQFGGGKSQGDDPIAPWYFDAKGKEILNHWLGGSGKNLTFSYDKSWTKYMSENRFLKKELFKRALARSYSMYSDGNTKYSETSGNFGFEIDNSYNTGYGMLHGTQYFSYFMTGKYDKSTDSYIFNFNLKWTDQINHNNNVIMDRVFNKITRAVAHPADYWITIKWSQTIIIKNKEWESLH